jgi:hypothetical protein
MHRVSVTHVTLEVWVVVWRGANMGVAVRKHPVGRDTVLVVVVVVHV